MTDFPRNLLPSIERALRDTPVVLLNGARQVGKSTLARSMAERAGVPYLTLDDATVLATANRDPAGFVAGLPRAVVIDEVQFAPALFPAIKRSVDQDRRGGRFLLTGSTNVMLLPRLADSLAGRMEVLTLHPLSQGELHSRQDGFVDWAFSGAPLPGPLWRMDTEETVEAVARGGFPEPAQRADERRRSAWIEAYLTAILQRDVRELAHIEGLAELPRLLSLLAARTGGLLNTADIARSCAIPSTTLARYLTLLRAVFLYGPLPAWATNLDKRLVKAPKIHLVDSALAAHLAGYDAVRLRNDPHAGGLLLETFVVAEIRKQLTWARHRASAFHFRSVSGQEVDLVLEASDGRVVGIEVKSSESVDAKDFKGLEALSAICGPRWVRGVVLYRGHQVVPFGTFHAMPIASLWHEALSWTEESAA